VATEAPVRAGISAVDILEVRGVLAPTGSLRVALHSGSPSSLVQSNPNQPPRGLGYELGRALAEDLGVAFEPVVFPRNLDMLTAVKDGQADFTLTNASSERAREMDFSPTVLDVEKSVWVPPGSALRTLDDLKGKALRIGVPEASATARDLATIYPRAVLVQLATFERAMESMRGGQLDGYAANNAVLHELSDQLAGSVVLPGRWGVEHFAIGIPRGRDTGRAYLRSFVARKLADGTVERAALRAGLRGAISSRVTGLKASQAVP
jgi:polar amino acid transport system substrate-binding protein